MPAAPLTRAALLLALAAPALCQHGAADAFRPRILDAGDGPAKALAGFVPAAGLRVEAIAAEPDLANPVAFHIADDGRIYVVETHRLGQGVIDMRSHQGWVDEDLACLTVDDRIAEIREHFAGQLDAWRSQHERLRCLIDDDGDGRPDRSTVFADGFDGLADGIAAGVLADGRDVWLTSIPALWKLTDADRDGLAEARALVHGGFGVHFSLIGHDLHGLRIGPDRRLYFSIGDRGFHVETEGRVLAHPHEGAVLRCELDGSGLEVVHRGLRNPQELAFDAHGNLFTGDNNSDGGDKARWVQVVEGGDSGWTIGFQWLPTRGAWNEEGWWKPRHPGQPAFLVPPVDNLANGPSGLAFYPGTGLPARYADHFFLCEFRGGPAQSGVLSFRCEEDGAGFRLGEVERFLWKVLATDIEFGPRPGLYVLDWVEGWGLTGRGRVWRTFDPSPREGQDAAPTGQLLNEGLAGRGVGELRALLAHPDQRIRQRAQFALCDAGAAGAAALRVVAAAPGPRLPRLHAIWGLGYLARRGDRSAGVDLIAVLGDADAELRAQAAKMLGDAPNASARDALIGALGDAAARVRFYAAQALGRLGDARAVGPLLDLARANADRDAYLRHAAVVALARIGAREPVLAAAGDASRAVRMAVLLAMRRWQDPRLATFLADPEPDLVLEAARAIHDLRIRGALPALAALSARPGLDGNPLIRRVLGAHRILGSATDARALLAFAGRGDVPEAMRIEALRILAEWRAPDGQDRVLGEWRPLPERNTLVVRTAIRDALPALCATAPDAVLRALCEVVVALDVPDAARPLAALVATERHEGETRARALDALSRVGDAAIRRAAAGSVPADAPLPLRRAARSILAELDPGAALPLLVSLCRDASLEPAERRGALETVAKLPGEAADAALAAMLAELDGEAFPGSLRLDLLEAGLSRASGPAFAAAAGRVAEAGFDACLEGGDRGRGERLFREHPAAQCLRCHRLGEQGGEAGPALDGVGARRDRAYLLRALLEPAAEIADGFAQVTVTRTDGSLVAGVLRSETADDLVLIDAEGASIRIPVAEIAGRQTGGSAMPPMGKVLSRVELRDLVEFLATRR
jgi:quinoprotein glucose dehydrogenase